MGRHAARLRVFPALCLALVLAAISVTLSLVFVAENVDYYNRVSEFSLEEFLKTNKIFGLALIYSIENYILGISVHSFFFSWIMLRGASVDQIKVAVALIMAALIFTSNSISWSIASLPPQGAALALCLLIFFRPRFWFVVMMIFVHPLSAITIGLPVYVFSRFRSHWGRVLILVFLLIAFLTLNMAIEANLLEKINRSGLREVDAFLDYLNRQAFGSVGELHRLFCIGFVMIIVAHSLFLGRLSRLELSFMCLVSYLLLTSLVTGIVLYRAFPLVATLFLFILLDRVRLGHERFPKYSIGSSFLG